MLAGAAAAGLSLGERLDDLPVGAFETTPDGRILYCNDAALKMVGYGRADVAHLRAGDLYLRAGDRAALTAALESVEEHRFELPLRHRDGRAVWVAGVCRALRDEAGGVVLYRACHIDISQWRRREMAAHALQPLRDEVWRMTAPDDIDRVLVVLGEALDAVGIDFVEYGVNTVEDSAGIQQVHVAARLRGGEWHRTERVGGPVARALVTAWRRQSVFYRPDLEADDSLRVREILAHRAGRRIRSVIDVPFSHGTVSANSARADAFGDEDVAFLRQVAEVLSQAYRRLDDLRALAASEARYRALVETPALGLALLRPDGACLYVSPQMERLSGHRAQDFYADAGLFVELAHPEDAALVRRALTEATTGEAASPVEVRWRRRDGSDDRWLSQSAYPVLDEGGQVAAVQIIVQDITDRRHMWEEQVQLERLRGLGEMAAGVSHNLNNMLTGVLAPAEMLMMAATDERTQREAKTIFEAGGRAADLVRRLIRSVRGDETEAVRGVPVTEEVAEVVEATSPRWQDEAQARGVIIDMRVEVPDVPDVRATRTGLHDALVNLVFNAVDALPEGGQIALRGGVEGTEVWLEVADDGIGMDEETRTHALEPFFTTKMTVGTGLGLSTVYGTVSRWGGTVALSSVPGEGTRVRLRLPQWQEERTAPPSRSEPVAEAAGGRILVVEDEEVVRNMLRGALARRHAVETAATGPEALGLFAAGAFDLAFIDLGLPGMAGDQVARELLRRDPSLATVLISGWDLEEGDARRAPFDFYLRKPFGALKLLNRTVAEAMAIHGRRQAGNDGHHHPPEGFGGEGVDLADGDGQASRSSRTRESMAASSSGSRKGLSRTASAPHRRA